VRITCNQADALATWLSHNGHDADAVELEQCVGSFGGTPHIENCICVTADEEIQAFAPGGTPIHIV
jgi:hypothetical protein